MGVKVAIKCGDTYPTVGCYSQAVLAGHFLYISGLVGMDKDNKLVNGGIIAQARKIFEHLGSMLRHMEADYSTVVKTTLMVKDNKSLAEINMIYEEYFPRDSPARTIFQVENLPTNADISIDAIAFIKIPKQYMH